MADINTEISNPYYVNSAFLSYQSDEHEHNAHINLFNKHAQVLSFYKPVQFVANWRYEGIGTNELDEPCYEFQLIQWPLIGGKTLLMVVEIPIGVFYQTERYVSRSNQLHEDHPLIPALKEYLECLSRGLSTVYSPIK